MAKTTKKVAKKTKEKKEKSFAERMSASLTGKPVIIDDDYSEFVPWKVPFKHKGLQKITGGLLGGKVMLIEGESQTGKSWLLYELLGGCLRMGGKAYLEDAERAFEPVYGKCAGMKPTKENFLLNHEKIVEYLGKNFKNFILNARSEMKDDSKPIVVALDSIVPTRCLYQYASDQKDEQAGHGWEHRANAMYEMVDVLSPILDDYAASLVLIGQLRTDNRAGLFKDPTKTLMKELEYRATQMLRGKNSTLEKDETDKNKRLGMKVRWEGYKNRFVKPKQVVNVTYNYEKGLLKYSGFLDLLVRENELVRIDKKDPDDGRKKIKGCSVVGDESNTFYELKDADKMFEDHPHLLEPNYIKVHEQDDEIEGM